MDQPISKRAKKNSVIFPPFNSNEYYFETTNRSYWFVDPLGWKNLKGEDFARHLHNFHGLSIKVSRGVQSEVNRTIFLVQQNWVNVTSDLAGYFGPQILTHNDARILIKNSPHLLEPHEGDYPVWIQFMDGMLAGEPGEHLNCWCADVVRHVYAHQLGTFIVPILCGPRGCGKSLFQKVINVATGGRSSRPYSAMTGGTPFNEHLFAAEHWMIEDEYSSGDIKSRNQLGTALKNFVANECKLNHGKNKVAFMCPPLLQYLTVTLNDGLENIAQLPRKNPSIDDKASLYDCSLSAMPMPTGTPEEKAAFWAQLMKELPCWIYDLIHKTPMPEKWKSGRFMVPWRADKVSQALDELEPYMRLRELIYILLWKNPFSEDSSITIERRGGYYQGSSTQIESDLCSNLQTKALSDRLFQKHDAGRLLTRLCEHFPREFVHKRRASARLYLLYPPVTDDNEVTAPN